MFYSLYNQINFDYIILASAAPPAKKVAKAKKSAKPPTHPKFSEMIPAAITALKERKGSSLLKILIWLCFILYIIKLILII